MASRIDAVAFDVNETLFDIAGLGPHFEKAGLSPDLVPLWFARVLRDGFALTVLGEYRSFPDIGAEHLQRLRDGMSEDEAREVLAGFPELDPHPDVEPALRRLREAGVRAVTLTNGTAAVTAKLLERAGLTSYVEATLSVDEVRRWKPAPEPYSYAARTLGVEPGRLALVAAHGWDVHGAKRAGLRTGYVTRLEGWLSPTFEEPDAMAETLDGVIEQLVDG